MFHFNYGLNGMRSLTRFATAYQTMAVAAGEVFFRRSLMMASGSMSVPDAVNMVAEKAATLTEAAAEATNALVKGEDPIGVAAAALEPYGTRTAANVQVLRS
jgi:flagellar biosynthesis/type III secretory pathway ATPase